jgi:glutaredoxin
LSPNGQAEMERIETIEIYGRPECPYCASALEQAEAILGVGNVSIQPEGSMPAGSLLEGRDTVPVVVVNGVPVGGAAELALISRSLASPGKNSHGSGITGGRAKTMDPHDSHGQAGGAKSKSKSKSSKSSKSPSKRKPSAYAKFVKKFSSDHKGKFKGPALMKSAGAAWGKMSDSEKAKFK